MAISQELRAALHKRAGGQCECTMSVCSHHGAGQRCRRNLSVGSYLAISHFV